MTAQADLNDWRMLQVKVTHAGPRACEACVYSRCAVLRTLGFTLDTCMLTHVFKRKPIDVCHRKTLMQQPNDSKIKNVTDFSLRFSQFDLQVSTPLVEDDKHTSKPHAAVGLPCFKNHAVNVSEFHSQQALHIRRLEAQQGLCWDNSLLLWKNHIRIWRSHVEQTVNSRH